MSIRQQRIRNSIRNQRTLRNLVRGIVAGMIVVGVGGLMLLAYYKTCMFLIGVQAAEYGELEDKVICPAILIKKETVVTAPARGRFENRVREGERVRGGSVAGWFYSEAEIKPQSLAVPFGGVICFKPDGWEDVLQGFSLERGDQNIMDYSPRQPNDGSFQYETGEPLFKVIDNLVPLNMVVAMRLSDLGEPLAVGDRLRIGYQALNLGEAVCQSVWTGGGRQTAILNLSGFNEALLDQRKIEIDCVRKAYRGIIIPEQSVVRGEAGDAVYQVKKGRVELTGVEVVAVCNGQAIVEGIQPGDTIVSTPNLVSEGMLFKR